VTNLYLSVYIVKQRFSESGIADVVKSTIKKTDMEVCFWCIKEGLLLREIDLAAQGFLDTSLCGLF
jgi:hypothetical protein